MPERNQYQVKTLTIDGKEVCAAEHQTILEVARENGIDIPTLCHFDGLKGIGACRLCVVEVKGSNKLLPACVTQAQEGMEVTAHSPQLLEFRKLIVELMLTERNHVCAVCVSSGHCELQALAQKLGVNHVTLPYLHMQVRNGRLSPALRCRPQSLRPLHSLHARVRRDRRRSHLGHHRPRHRLAHDHRSGRALGSFGNLHQLRQMRQRLPGWRTCRERAKLSRR